MFIIKVAVKENSFKWNLQRDKLLQCWIFRKISDVPQRFILGPLFFLIHINNLSNNIVALAIKQSYVHTHVCSYISETWIENPQIQLKMSFLISYIGKIDKFLKFSVVVCELRFWIYNLLHLVTFLVKLVNLQNFMHSAGCDTICNMI